MVKLWCFRSIYTMPSPAEQPPSATQCKWESWEREVSFQVWTFFLPWKAEASRFNICRGCGEIGLYLVNKCQTMNEWDMAVDCLDKIMWGKGSLIGFGMGSGGHEFREWSWSLLCWFHLEKLGEISHYGSLVRQTNICQYSWEWISFILKQ